MITSKTIRTVTDMRKNADGLLELVKTERRPIGIFRHNKLDAYLIDPQTLETLEAFVEDYLDQKLIKERIKGKSKDFRYFEDFWKNKNLPR